QTAAQSRPWASKAICTGLASSGDSFSEANRVIFKPLPTVMRRIASSPSRKTWAPLGPGAGLLVFTGVKGGGVGASAFRARALGHAPDAPVPVGGHDVEDFHLALHDHAVGLVLHEPKVGPSPVDRVAVHRAVTVEPAKVLVEDGPAQVFEGAGVPFRFGGAGE